MSHYGKLNAEQLAAIQRFVRHRVVHDLGCGPEFHHRDALLRLGAKFVVGVDKELPEPNLRAEIDPRSQYLRTSFKSFKDDIDVAFLSWPVNRPEPGLLSLIASARTVIYLGSNTDSNACGTERLFRTLLMRRVVAHVPEKRNTLIIYGQTVRNPRKPLLEEQAGMDHSGIYQFEAGR